MVRPFVCCLFVCCLLDCLFIEHVIYYHCLHFAATAEEVSKLNHQTTILADQLPALRQGTQSLGEGLSRIKNEVIAKQQELERDLREREEREREGIAKTKQELEVQRSLGGCHGLYTVYFIAASATNERSSGSENGLIKRRVASLEINPKKDKG